MEIHVEPEHVKVYTVYRNDKINHIANPIKLHYGMNAREHNVEPMEKTDMECKTSRDFFCEYNSVIGMETRYYLQGYKGTLITDGYQISSQL